MGPDGFLYGTTAEGGAFGFGTVFELKPPPNGAGAWIEDIIYRFQPGLPALGYYPAAPVAMAANGTTCCGGTVYGVMFELQPPNSGRSLDRNRAPHLTTSSVGTSADSATIFAVEP